MKIKQPYLDELKGKLDKIKEASNKGPKELINIVIEYIPLAKSVNFQITDEDLKEGKIRKTILRLVVIFHPDKAVKEEKIT